MKCPKCGYTRKMGETAPEWQCPSCSVAYAKVSPGSDSGARSRSRGESGGGNTVLALLVIAAIAGAGWMMWKDGRRASSQPVPVATEYAHASVIMYSTTTCGFCVQKRAQLRAAGIPFVEYFLDREPERFQELIRKLEAAGMRGGGIGTPSFEVNGTILLNNPSLDTIRRHL